MVNRATGNGKNPIYDEIHGILDRGNLPFQILVMDFKKYRSHDLPKQPQIRIVGSLPTLLQKHLWKQAIQPQHQRVALEIGANGSIRILFIFLTV